MGWSKDRLKYVQINLIKRDDDFTDEFNEPKIL